MPLARLVRIATRKSPLALAQTRWVAARLASLDPDLRVEEVHVVTEGDRVLDRPLAKMGGKGLFVSEVEAALADGRADIAVHSMKDVPESLLAGMTIACVPARADPRDGLVTRDGSELMDLAAGARVGTSSLRRAVQLRRRRNDLALTMLRGNVGTRLSRVLAGTVDAAVVAMAGLERLGLDALGVLCAEGPRATETDRPSEVHRLTVTPLPVDECVPAVGQGALAVEARADDGPLLSLLARLEDRASRACVEAERAVLSTLEGGCSTPIAAHARIEGGMLRMDALVGSIDGEVVLSTGTAEVFDVAWPDAAARARVVGVQLAERLIASGGDSLVRAARAAADPHAFLYARS